MPNFPFVPLLAVALVGCAQIQPTPDLIEAREAVSVVDPLEPYVPAEVREAKRRLAAAQIAYENGQSDIANRRAREAIVSAQLAEARADAQQAQALTRVLERRLSDARRSPSSTALR